MKTQDKPRDLFVLLDLVGMIVLIPVAFVVSIVAVVRWVADWHEVDLALAFGAQAYAYAQSTRLNRLREQLREGERS